MSINNNKEMMEDKRGKKRKLDKCFYLQKKGFMDSRFNKHEVYSKNYIMVFQVCELVTFRYVTKTYCDLVRRFVRLVDQMNVSYTLQFYANKAFGRISEILGGHQRRRVLTITQKSYLECEQKAQRSSQQNRQKHLQALLFKYLKSACLK